MNKAFACLAALLVSVSACSNQARSLGDGLTVEEDQAPADLCTEKYRNKIENCDAGDDNSRELCEDMYGPSAGDAGDPPAYVKCITTVADESSNCLDNAVSQYERCTAYWKWQATQEGD